MKNLMRFLKPYRCVAIIAPLFKMLEALLELFVPLVMTDIIDIGIESGDTKYILKKGLMLILLALFGLCASVTAQYFAAKTATGFARDMKSELFCHIQGFSFSKLDTIGTATLITRLTTDSDKVQNGVNMTLRLFLRSPFIVFGAVIMAFTINKECALVMLISIPILAAVVFGIMLGTVPLYTRVQKLLDKSILTVRENLGGVRVIRAFNMQETEKERFEKESLDYADASLKASKISALLNPITFLIVNAALVVILYSGAIKVDLGTITKGQLIAIVNYMSQILVELIKLADLVIVITRSLSSAKRIDEVFRING